MRRAVNENWSSHSGPGPSSRSDDESRSDSSTSSTSKGAPTVFHTQLLPLRLNANGESLANKHFLCFSN
jgi:hypothetical protein